MLDVELKPYLQTVETYLARPWMPFSTAVFLNNYIEHFVQRDGYMMWNKTQLNTKQFYFIDFGNIDPSANTTTWVKWAKCLINKKMDVIFTAERFIKARTWLSATGIPYDHGLVLT
jgi:pectinesterase